MGNSKRIQNDWLTSLEKVIREDEESVPEGWKTMSKLAAEMGVSQPQAYKNVAALLDAGLAEHRTFKVWRRKRLYPVPHYKLKK